jgi:cytidylate kinase
MNVVAISRQVGSWGDEIAGLVAEQLGLQLTTREQMHIMAQACDDDFKRACSIYADEVPNRFWDRHFFSSSANTALFESLTFDLASKGDVVILGRGAQVVLNTIPGVFRARIVAPHGVRVQRVMEKKGITQEEAERFVSWYGHQRRKLIEKVYRTNLDDWSLYDLILNTSELSKETGAHILATAVKKKAKQVEYPNQKEKLTRMALIKSIEVKVKKQQSASFLQDIKVVDGGDGIIRLTGFVHQNTAREEAEEIAKAQEGVTGVENNLVVINDFNE